MSEPKATEPKVLKFPRIARSCEQYTITVTPKKSVQECNERFEKLLKKVRKSERVDRIEVNSVRYMRDGKLWGLEAEIVGIKYYG